MPRYVLLARSMTIGLKSPTILSKLFTGPLCRSIACSLAYGDERKLEAAGISYSVCRFFAVSSASTLLHLATSIAVPEPRSLRSLSCVLRIILWLFCSFSFRIVTIDERCSTDRMCKR